MLEIVKNEIDRLEEALYTHFTTKVSAAHVSRDGRKNLYMCLRTLFNIEDMFVLITADEDILEIEKRDIELSIRALPSVDPTEEDGEVYLYALKSANEEVEKVFRKCVNRLLLKSISD